MEVIIIIALAYAAWCIHENIGQNKIIRGAIGAWSNSPNVNTPQLASDYEPLVNLERNSEATDDLIEFHNILHSEVKEYFNMATASLPVRVRNMLVSYEIIFCMRLCERYELPLSCKQKNAVLLLIVSGMEKEDAIPSVVHITNDEAKARVYDDMFHISLACEKYMSGSIDLLEHLQSTLARIEKAGDYLNEEDYYEKGGAKAYSDDDL